MTEVESAMPDELERRLPHADELHAMDLADLKAAFAGESQAAEKYLVFAEKAAAEGLPTWPTCFVPSPSPRPATPAITCA